MKDFILGETKEQIIISRWVAMRMSWVEKLEALRWRVVTSTKVDIRELRRLGKIVSQKSHIPSDSKVNPILLSPSNLQLSSSTNHQIGKSIIVKSSLWVIVPCEFDFPFDNLSSVRQTVEHCTTSSTSFISITSVEAEENHKLICLRQQLHIKFHWKRSSSNILLLNVNNPWWTFYLFYFSAICDDEGSGTTYIYLIKKKFCEVENNISRNACS